MGFQRNENIHETKRKIIQRNYQKKDSKRKIKKYETYKKYQKNCRSIKSL